MLLKVQQGLLFLNPLFLGHSLTDLCKLLLIFLNGSIAELSVILVPCYYLCLSHFLLRQEPLLFCHPLLFLCLLSLFGFLLFVVNRFSELFIDVDLSFISGFFGDYQSTQSLFFFFNLKGVILR